MDEPVMPAGSSLCLRVQEHLPLLGEETLSRDEEVRLHEHLKTCPTCRRDHEFVLRLRLAMPEPPADLGIKILAELLPGGSDELSIRRGKWFGGGWGATVAFASIVLAFVTGFGGGRLVPWAQSAAAPDPLAFVDPEVDSWAEDWFVAGAPVLEALSDEVLNLLALEMTR